MLLYTKRNSSPTLEVGVFLRSYDKNNIFKEKNFFMNAIVTVIGKDRVGIIAAVCNTLAKLNINVLDISQTILQGNFTMVMAVDISEASVKFLEIKNALSTLGDEMKLSIRIQREEIFDAMHTI